jgi:hypothetical protein
MPQPLAGNCESAWFDSRFWPTYMTEMSAPSGIATQMFDQ